MDNLISIIIPNYNRAKYLEQALNSVKRQTYNKWEVLVVDDGSTDNSEQLVHKLTRLDDRIHWIRRKGDLKGASVCRNLGLKSANGKYVVFLDSDDLLAPHCLEQRISVMQNDPSLDFSVFKMQFFKETPGDDQRIWNIETEETALERFLKLDAVWQTSGPIWKLKALINIGGFNPNLKCWQDIDIHLKALFGELRYKVFYDLPIDCYYRKDSVDSISQSSTNSPEKLKSKIELYQWVSGRIKHDMLKNNQMAINILVSSINGGQFKIYHGFYKSIKSQLSKHIKNVLLKMWLMKKSRLDRLSVTRGYYFKLKNILILKSTIGTYYV